MITYLVRRLLWLPFLLLIIAFVTFALGLYGPGDPVLVMLGQHADPEAAARVRHELGLDRPFLVQYADYVWNALHGDFGESLKYRGQSVGRLMATRLAVTVQFNTVVVAVGLAVGIPLGIVAALNRNNLADYLIVSLTVAGISFPVFAIAPMLMWFLAARFHILPSGGWDGIFSRRIIMPTLVLAIGPAAVFVRQTRANMLEVLDQDYVRTARAKGLRERTVIVFHALRNALIPLLTIFGLMLGGLVGGGIITEGIFGIPGIGRLVWDAFTARDYPVIMAYTLLVAAAYALANLLVDVCYGFVDPRIRYG
jgi:ABC-type dipeptide/oligopeptide/nickel transport system permease component